jgi:hypothetical protein
LYRCSMTDSSTSTARLPASTVGPRQGHGRAETVSSISRSHRQRSAGSGVKDQPELRKGSGDAVLSSITRSTTFGPGPRGLEPRTCGLRVWWRSAGQSTALRLSCSLASQCYPSFSIASRSFTG